MLVLDDTLSALDVHTEKLVEDALRRVLADATGIVVAHRASTVLLADKVALLQDGTITHVGRHSDLLADRPGLPRAARRGRPDRRRARGGAGMSTTGTPTRPPTSHCPGRGLARRRRRRPGGHRRGLRAAAGPLAPAARRPAAPAQEGALGAASAIVLLENASRLSIPYLVKEGIDRGIPPIREDGDTTVLFTIVGIALFATIAAGGHPAHLPGAVGPDRPGHALRDPAAGLPALPEAQPGLPRRLHLGPGDLPADLRHGRDLRDARDRLRRAGHRGAHPRRHRRSCCSCSTSSSRSSR